MADATESPEYYRWNHRSIPILIPVVSPRYETVIFFYWYKLPNVKQYHLYITKPDAKSPSEIKTVLDFNFQLRDTFYVADFKDATTPIGRRYWAVSESDGTAKDSIYPLSNIDSFRIVDSRIPIAVKPLNFSYLKKSDSLKLIWQQPPGMDVNNDSAMYYYHVVRDSVGNFTQSSKVSQNPFIPSVTLKLNSLAAGKYFWRVCNSLYPTSWSDTMCFTLVSDSIPLIIPLPNDDTILTTRPSFRWYSAKDAYYYSVYVSRDRNFTSSLKERASDTSYRLANSLKNDSWYYWRVCSNSKPGEYSYSDSFYVSNFAPIQTTILPDQRGQIAVTLKRNTILLSWTDNSFHHLRADLFDLRGKRVSTLQQETGLRKKTVEWHLTHSSGKNTLSSGLYVVHLTFNNKNHYSGKIIIP
ncbi:MAG: hypothetical protein JW795_15115 [Chitinivibrionales bacterium]|nr:hypothetical protein [Chitinivibrionales bacterium]